MAMTALLHVVRLVGAVDPVGVGRVDGSLAGRVRPLQRGQSPRPRGRHGRWRTLRQLRTLRMDDRATLKIGQMPLLLLYYYYC